MPATLPTVRGSAVALYPVMRRTQIGTGVQIFINGSEQRFKRSAPLANFELRYTRLPAADRDALKLFVANTKGAFDSTWTFALTSSYTTMAFIDDAFTSVELTPLLYNVTLRFRQVQKGGAVAGAGTSFPVMSTGAVTQRPFVQTVRYRTTKNDNPTGMLYSFPWYSGGLTGFPTRGLLSWQLEFSSITDSDMAALEAFFVNMNGRWQTFSFTDPDSGTVYPTVRFDQDTFEYRYLAKNQAATTLLLTETN